MYHPDPSDYWRWTSEGLKKIVTEAGFEIVRFRGIMGRASIGVQLWQDAIHTKLHPRLRPFFYIIMQALVQFFDIYWNPGHRDSEAGIFILVASKR